MHRSFDKIIPKPYGTSVGLGRAKGFKPTQKQLNALFKYGVRPGCVLNPCGKLGNTDEARERVLLSGKELKISSREGALKRKRLLLQEKKAVALEMHELQQLARENATAAMQTLIEISRDPRAPQPSRIAASTVILDRGYGKSSQTNITKTVNDGKASTIESGDLDSRIDRALKRVESLTDRKAKTGTGEKQPADLRVDDKHSKWTN